MKRIVLIVPSLNAGGMERVMSKIANHMVSKKNLKIYLILLTKNDKFYTISDDVILIEPTFSILPNFKGKIKILKYLRSKLKEIRPYSILSFGSMYNSFVMLASIGLKNKIFLSDRSTPYRNSFKSFFNKAEYRNDGFVHYILKKILYKCAYGIIVQTKFAKEVEQKNLSHKNIVVIHNPVQPFTIEAKNREKIILNVGRFIKSKQQIELIKIFAKIRIKGWILVFLGDGSEITKARDMAIELNIIDFVRFEGNVLNVEEFYIKSEIFAFTSTTEGFPNALAEALITPLASIAFDCIAGPSDLINNNYNGILIPANDFDLFSLKLNELVLNEELREKYRNNSKVYMKRFNHKVILDEFNNILTK